MKKQASRFLAFFLVIAMIVGMIPVPAQAAAKKAAVKKVTLNYNEYVMKKGAKLKLKATIAPKNAKTTLKWKSSNKKVATVSSKGVVTAKAKKGKATITVTAGSKKATCKITIGTPVKKITASDLKLTVGQSAKINAKISPKNATVKKLTYQSSNKGIAKVDAKGKVTAVKEGKAKITIKAADCNRVKKTITVTVSKAEDGSSDSGSGDSGSGDSGDSGSGGSDSATGEPGGSGTENPPVTDPDLPEGHFRITLYNGTTKIGEEIKQKGTLLKDTKAPYLDKKIFLGWYYDQSCSKKVQDGDILNKSISLYGNYGEASLIPEAETPDFIGAEDVAPDYSVLVNANDPAAAAEDVLAALELTNVTNPSRTDESATVKKDVLQLTPVGAGKFKVSAVDGFEEGATYRIEIKESAKVPGLVFDGQTKDVIYCNFTVKKDETLNLSLDKEVKYLPAKSLSANDADTVLSYAGLYQAETDESGNTVYKPTDTYGSFTYEKGAFLAGDIIAVYEGDKPADRNLDSALGQRVAYIEITEVKGEVYSYKSANATDVLFTPDIIPVDLDENDGTTGWTQEGTEVFVPTVNLDFTAGYEAMGLDHTTVVEPGDFVAFYRGDYGQDNAIFCGYGKITGVSVISESTKLTYTQASYDEVMAAMDIYNESDLTEEQLDSIDVEQIEQVVAEQVKESGFAQEAGAYLAEMAVETDELQEMMGESNLSLKECQIRYEDGTEVDADDLALSPEMASPSGAEVKVSVSKKLEHFEKGTGFRVEVAIKYAFDVGKKGGNAKVAIEMTAIFETEILLGFSASGGAVWKKAWIIPYIYDYEMSGSINQGLYSGIAVTATAKLKGVEGPVYGPDKFETEGLEDYAQKILDLSQAIKNQMEQSKQAESEGTASGGLEEKYARFVEDASDEWIELVTCPIFETSGSLDPYYVTAYSINVDFVISANMSVAVGMSFQYEKYQKHCFTMMLFHRKESKSETINVRAERYQFDFYVMGMLGVRVGIRAKVLFGLFSTKLAGVGLELEAGAYARLWGYFYYCLSWEKGKGKESSATGAMLIEIGAYLNLRLAMEVLNGSFSYKPSLCQKEWPIWNVGERDNVLEFGYDEKMKWKNGAGDYDDLPDAFEMVREKSMELPEEIFRMYYMDLKNGGCHYKSYDARTRGSYDTKSAAYDDEKNFFVEVSNPAFTYNPIDNKLTINPVDGIYTYEGTITFTWKKPDFVYASKTLSRTFEISWIDPDAGHLLVYDTKGGTKIRTKVYGPDVVIPQEDKPAEPKKIGYKFGGWYLDEACSEDKKTTIPDVMPDYDLTLYAKWIPIPNQYKVLHYYEALSTRYIQDEDATELAKTYHAATGAYQTGDYVYTDDEFTQEQLIENNGKILHGFEVDKDRTTKEFKVAPDGSTVVEIYYKRQIHKVTYSMGTLKSEENPDTVIRYRYEEDLLLPTYFMPGYAFMGWQEEELETMDDQDLTYTAIWEPNKDTPYYAEYYVKKPGTEATYVMLGGENGRRYFEGVTDADVPVEKHALGDVGYSLDKVLVNGKPAESGKIDAYGKLLLQYYYTGESYSIDYDLLGGQFENPETVEKDYSAYTHGYKLSLNPVTATKEGYHFIGWLEGDEAISEISLLRVGDIHLTAEWRAEKREIQLIDEDGKTALGAVNATYNQVVPTLTDAKIPKKTGYDFAGYYAEDGTQYYDESGNGLVVFTGNQDISLKAAYTPAKVTIRFDGNGADEEAAPMEATYGEKYPDLPKMQKAGYHQLGWTVSGNTTGGYVTENSTITDAKDQTLVAQWAPNEDTPYVIEYYVEDESGSESGSVSGNEPGSESGESTQIPNGYSLYTVQHLAGTTGEKVSALEQAYQIAGYTLDADNENTVAEGEIAADGSSLFKLYFKKGTFYTITLDYGIGLSGEGNSKETSFHADGDIVFLPHIGNAEHMKLAGWMSGGVFYKTDSYYTIKGESKVFEAVWEKGTYQVSYRNNAPAESGVYEDFRDETLTYDVPAKAIDNIFDVGSTYEFIGWNSKADGSGDWYQPGDALVNVKDTLDDFNGAGMLYAQWKETSTVSENGLVPYYVIYILEDETGMPRDDFTIRQYGKEGEMTTAVAYEFAHLKANPFEQKVIKCGEEAESNPYGYEGYTVVEVTYDRDTYQLKLDYDGGVDTNGSSGVSIDVLDGGNIELTVMQKADLSAMPQPTKAGYQFVGWDVNVPYRMPSHDIKAVAQYEVDDTRAVTVNYYMQNLEDENYTLEASEIIYGEKGKEISPKPAEFAGFKTPEAKTITVAEDGSSVCNYYYDRNAYTLAWDAPEGSISVSENSFTKGTVKYGAPITPPTFTREGYDGSWIGFTGTMPAQDVTYQAAWSPRKVAYHVIYRLQKRTGGTFSYETLGSQRFEALAGTVMEVACEPPASVQDRITAGYRKPFAQWAEIAGDGSTEIIFDYLLQRSYLSYDFAGGEPTDTNYAPAGYYYYGETKQIPLTTKVQRKGCEAVGWYDASDPDQTILESPYITVGNKNVTYKLKWDKNEYSITYDLDDDEAKNPNNPSVYHTGEDFNIAGATCEGKAFAGWVWNSENAMPTGVVMLDNGLVHVTENATGDISLKAKWVTETRMFAAAYYDAQNAEPYIYHYPVSESDTFTLAQVAPPLRKGYLFSYYTKKIPKEDYGYYTVILEPETKIKTLNLNTDFVTACWMKLVEKDGKTLISVNSERELNIACEYLRSDDRYEGILLTNDITLYDLKNPFWDLWKEGYVLDGGNHSFILENTGTPLIGQNDGKIVNLKIEGTVNRETELGECFALLAEENRGLIEGCTVNGGILAHAAYVGGMVGVNKGKLVSCRLYNSVVILDDSTPVQTATIGGLVAVNAPEGEMTDCEVSRSTISTKKSQAQSEDATIMIGGMAGQNLGLIETGSVLDSTVGNRITLADGYKLGNWCVGGIAGLDAPKDFESADSVRGIYNCLVNKTYIDSGYVAGGIIGECNFASIEGNELSYVTVFSNTGYAGQVAGILRSDRMPGSFADSNRIAASLKATKTIMHSGAKNAGIIGLCDQPEDAAQGSIQIELMDNESKIITRFGDYEKAEKLNPGTVFYAWKGAQKTYSFIRNYSR